MMTRSALYQTNTLSLIFIVVVHCINSPWIDKHQLYSLWFDQTRARTHRSTALNNRCGVNSMKPRQMFHCKVSLTYTLYVDSYPLSLTRSLTELDCIYRQHNECLIRSRNCLPFTSTCVHPSFLVGFWLLIFLVLFCIVLLCVFTFLVPCCDVRYDFRI